jgi:aminopeptidase N
MTHYPSAYQVDRTAGTNPIRQPLSTLNDAGQLYGPIIYQKAPIVMRQLELMLGERAFREGLRLYLKRHAFANASWVDLVQLLDSSTPKDLAAWSRAWVEERGRPRFDTRVRVDPKGRITALTLTMTDPLKRSLVWPQKMKMAIGLREGVKLLDVDVSQATTTVTGAAGLERPLFVLPNGAGLGYGLFVLDTSSRDYLLAHIEDVSDSLTRGSAWITLWDNLLEGRVTPAAFFQTASRALPSETDEQNIERVLAYQVKTFWRFMSAEERLARSAAFETMLEGGLQRATSMSLKATWFNALRDTALRPMTLEWL